MKRLLFNLIAGLSLLLFVAAAVLWVRSHLDSDRFVIQRGSQFSLTSNDGLLTAVVCSRYVVRANARVIPAGKKPWPYSNQWDFKIESSRPWKDPSVPLLLNTIQVGRFWQPGDSGLGMMGVDSGYQLTARYWLLVVLLGLAPALWAHRFRQRKREQRIKGRICLKCGYDLRATPDRCPECGRGSERVC